MVKGAGKSNLLETLSIEAEHSPFSVFRHILLVTLVVLTNLNDHFCKWEICVRYLMMVGAEGNSCEELLSPNSESHCPPAAVVHSCGDHRCSWGEQLFKHHHKVDGTSMDIDFVGKRRHSSLRWLKSSWVTFQCPHHGQHFSLWASWPHKKLCECRVNPVSCDVSIKQASKMVDVWLAKASEGLGLWGPRTHR